MDFQAYFKDKKVTVMGLGLLGRGVGDTKFIAEAGAAEVIVTDLKSKEDLKESVASLEGYDNVRFVLGEHREEDFCDRDLILVAAGVPVDSPYLSVANEAGVPLKQSAALFAELSGIPIIGVTGTRGKSTVTHMIHHTLSTLTGEPVILGGNVRGVSNLQLLKEVHQDALAVMELDSWQLQGFGWVKLSPQIAVFTNFMEDHLNYYQTNGRSIDEAMDLYFADKANIFRYQSESSVFITTTEVFERAKRLPRVALGQEVVLVDESVIGEDVLLSMPGAHNRTNAALAYEALTAAGLEEEEILAGLASFPGVPGRLEYLGEKHDIKIYNDNNSTDPKATTAGLESVGDSAHKNVVLIAGGSNKNLSFKPLVDAIKNYCKAVVWLSGSGTYQIQPEVGGEVFASIDDAVKAGFAYGEPGDVLLFSPGFASFGMFKNEYERNDAFVKAVNSYE